MVATTRSRGKQPQQATLDSFLSPSKRTQAASSSQNTHIKSSPHSHKSTPTKPYVSSLKSTPRRPRAPIDTPSDNDANMAGNGESPDSSDVEAIKFELPTQPSSKRLVVLLSSDIEEDEHLSSASEDDEIEVIPARRTRSSTLGTQATQLSGKRTRLSSSPPSSRGSSTFFDASLDDAQPVRLDKGKKKLVVESEGESEEEPPPKKRKMSLKDLGAEKELRELREEIEPELIIAKKRRENANSKKSAFSKNLERLKRKRAGKPMSDEDEDEEEPEDEDDEDEPVPFKGARPGAISIVSDDDEIIEEDDDAEEEDEEFIIEDDAERYELELPDAFNMDSHQDWPHQFKVVCQLFVHLIVTGEDDRIARQKLLDTSYFRIPLNALRRHIASTRESLASSVWRPDFRKVLENRPELSMEVMRYSWPGCDACHLGARVSTIAAHLSGKKWVGLLGPRIDESDMSDNESQDVDASEDEDEDDEDDDDDDDEEEVVFKVGRICANRTRVYHEFSHWEHVLYDALQEQISLLRPKENEKGRRPKRMFVHADAPDDVDDPDAIMDWLDRKNVIAIEWSRFKEMLDSPQALDNMRADDDMVG